MPALNFWAQEFPQFAALVGVFAQLIYGGGINEFERPDLHWALDQLPEEGSHLKALQLEELEELA